MKKEVGPFDQAAKNVALLANNMIYSILTTIRIVEVQDETPDYTTIDNLMLGNPELYRIVLFKSKDKNIDEYQVN